MTRLFRRRLPVADAGDTHFTDHQGSTSVFDSDRVGSANKEVTSRANMIRSCLLLSSLLLSACKVMMEFDE